MKNRNKPTARQRTRRSAIAIASLERFAFERLENRQLLATDFLSTVGIPTGFAGIGATGSTEICAQIEHAACKTAKSSGQGTAIREHESKPHLETNCKKDQASDPKVPCLDTISLLAYGYSGSGNTASLDVQSPRFNSTANGTNTSPPATRANQTISGNPIPNGAAQNDKPRVHGYATNYSPAPVASSNDMAPTRTENPRASFLEPVSLMATSESATSIRSSAMNLEVGHGEYFSTLGLDVESGIRPTAVRSGLIDQFQAFSLVSNENSSSAQASDASSAENSHMHSATDAMMAQYKAADWKRGTSDSDPLLDEFHEQFPNREAEFDSPDSNASSVALSSAGSGLVHLEGFMQLSEQLSGDDLELQTALADSRGELLSLVIPDLLADDFHSVHLVESAVFFAILASGYPRRKRDDEVITVAQTGRHPRDRNSPEK